MVRSLTIKPVLNGWIVEAGCQTLVYANLHELSADLVRYYSDPDAVEKEFIAKAKNKTMSENAVTVPTGLLFTTSGGSITSNNPNISATR